MSSSGNIQNNLWFLQYVETDLWQTVLPDVPPVFDSSVETCLHVQFYQLPT